MARLVIAEVRGGFAHSPLAAVRLRSDNERLRSEVAQLREQMRIKDARLLRVPARTRPRYRPCERHAIMCLRAAAGWSAAQTARAFLLSPDKVADWGKALHDGRKTLVAIAEPVNRFPDYVRLLVRQLGVTFPTMGRGRIADTLCRGGLHLSASSVLRMLADKTPPTATACSEGSSEHTRAEEDADEDVEIAEEPAEAGRTVSARYAHHVWNVDLTLVPIFQGFWVPWVPHAILERWPLCWHVAVVVDHFSRAVVYAAAFVRKPDAGELCDVLERAVEAAQETPKYIITDQGSQFQGEYLDWCVDHDVQPRFGAVGKKGSIALVERFIRTMKSEGLRRTIVPLTLAAFTQELALFARWYNVHRPHRALAGATPAEVRDGRTPAHQRVGYETRPSMALRGKITERRGIQHVARVRKLELVIDHVEGRAHLPIVTLRQAA